MTTEQVPLAAQIAKVQREIRYAQEGHAPKAERLWSAVLATLQQHERAMAVVEAARNLIDRVGLWAPEEDLAAALAALDDAASAAGDAV